MKKVVLAVCLVLAFAMVISSEDTGNDAPTADEVIKKIEAQIFYPDEQENLESAGYTLIYGTQMLMKQLNMKLEYGNKAKAKGKEAGLFQPESLRKKAESKKGGPVTDTARTWPDYEVTSGPWILTDPVNLLMQIFIFPLAKTFPNDKWDRQMEEQDEGYKIIFSPKAKRPAAPNNNPLYPVVNSVALEINKEFLVTKLYLTYDQAFAEGLDLPGISKMVDDSEVEVRFDRQKDKLFIRELLQKIHSGSPNPQPPAFAYDLTLKYVFEFKEISGCLLPVTKDMSMPGSQLSGMLGDMEIHFLVEYLDYKVQPKAKKK